LAAATEGPVQAPPVKGIRAVAMNYADNRLIKAQRGINFEEFRRCNTRNFGTAEAFHSWGSVFARNTVYGASLLRRQKKDKGTVIGSPLACPGQDLNRTEHPFLCLHVADFS